MLSEILNRNGVAVMCSVPEVLNVGLEGTWLSR